MIKKIRLASLTSKWMGTPYEDYGNKPKEGCDCFSFILSMLEGYGIKLPDVFEGLTRDNYMDLWYKNRNKTIKIIDRFLLSVTTKKDLDRMRSGDIIFIKHKKTNEKGYVMYAGNSKVITVSPKFGVLAIPIKEYEISRVYRGFH